MTDELATSPTNDPIRGQLAQTRTDAPCCSPKALRNLDGREPIRGATKYLDYRSLEICGVHRPSANIRDIDDMVHSPSSVMACELWEQKRTLGCRLGPMAIQSAIKTTSAPRA